MKKIFVFLTLALVSFSLSEDVLEKIVAGFKKYLQEFPQEKIYLHTDRPYYTNGDTIWLKAYPTGGTFHEPSQLSNIVYIELINPDGKLAKQIKLLATNSSATGYMVLPDSIALGNYLLRAYTNWMKNNNEDYFFHCMIKIWSKSFAISHAVVQEKKLDIQFFPEGGDLVNGLTSEVAFKAIGNNGLGQEVKGKIVDETNATVCEFKSNLLGMGTFYITPRKEKSYRAIIDNMVDVNLPSTKEYGITLSVKNQPNTKSVTVRIQTTMPDLKTIYIIAQTRGIVCYSASTKIPAGIALVKIPKSVFPEGLAQITLTDQEGNPLAERLIFIDANKHPTIKITPDKPVYSPRELITLHVQATDTSGVPLIANLSLAVCDNRYVLTDNNRETINSYLLLSSELRGYIESPGYYFNPTNIDRYEALDNLLLTQGWRRFTIKKALELQWAQQQYAVEHGLTITGKMVDKHNNKPIANGKVTYMCASPIFETKIAQTNATGDFEINQVICYDSAKIFLQGETKKGGKWTKFILNNKPDFPALHFPLLPFSDTPTDFEKSLVAQSIEQKKIHYEFGQKPILLKEVVVQAKKEEREKGSKIYGRGSTSTKVAGNIALETTVHPLQMLQGREAGVSVSGAGQNWKVSIRGGGTPLILIDDMPVPIETLSSISVRDIESYTIWKGPNASIFGSRGINGVIGFYIKKGADIFERPTEGIYIFNVHGFQTEREFYAPKYEVQRPSNSKPDKRITLFWEPHVTTDSTGHAVISFYNHDEETKASGVIEGISLKGEPLVGTFDYEIKKK